MEQTPKEPSVELIYEDIKRPVTFFLRGLDEKAVASEFNLKVNTVKFQIGKYAVGIKGLQNGKTYTVTGDPLPKRRLEEEGDERDGKKRKVNHPPTPKTKEQVLKEITQALKYHPDKGKCESVVLSLQKTRSLRILQKTWCKLSEHQRQPISPQMIEPANMKTPTNFFKTTFPTLDDKYVDMTLPQGFPVPYENSALEETLGIIQRGHHSVCLLGASGCGKTSTIFQIAQKKWLFYIEASVTKGLYQAHLFPPLDGIEVRNNIGYLFGLDIAVRCMILLVCYIKRIVSTPYEWLLFQLQPLMANLVNSLVAQLDNPLKPLVVAHTFAGMDAFSGERMVVALDEAQLMRGKYTVQITEKIKREWNALQLWAHSIRKYPKFNLLISGTSFSLTNALENFNTMVAKMGLPEFDLVTKLAFLDLDDVRNFLNTCLDLEDVDKDVVLHICNNLQGRPRFAASFVSFIANNRGTSKISSWDPQQFRNKTEEFVFAFKQFRNFVIGLLRLEEHTKLVPNAVEDYKRICMSGYNHKYATALETPVLQQDILLPLKGQKAINIVGMSSVPPVFHAQPVEPMMVHAIEEYLKTTRILTE